MRCAIDALQVFEYTHIKRLCIVATMRWLTTDDYLNILTISLALWILMRVMAIKYEESILSNLVSASA